MSLNESMVEDAALTWFGALGYALGQHISLHLQNIYDEGELQLGATHKESLSVRQEGTHAEARRTRRKKL